MYFDQMLCGQLYIKSRAIIRSHEAALKHLSMTYPQALVILHLEKNEPCFVDAMAKQLSLDTGTMTPLVKRLVHHGMIIKQRDHLDERRVSLMLSEYGRSRVSEIKKALAKTAEKLTLSPQEVTALITLLNKIKL